MEKASGSVLAGCGAGVSEAGGWMEVGTANAAGSSFSRAEMCIRDRLLEEENHPEMSPV